MFVAGHRASRRVWENESEGWTGVPDVGETLAEVRGPASEEDSWWEIVMVAGSYLIMYTGHEGWQATCEARVSRPIRPRDLRKTSLQSLQEECTWGKETAKKARTQQHFESLENYIRALEAKVKDLQSDLEFCRKQHGGPPSAPSPADSQDAGVGVSIPPRHESSDPEPSSDNEGSSSTGDSDIERLIAPTRHLVVSLPFPFPSSLHIRPSSPFGVPLRHLGILLL
ncbi:hypothetical protein GSI_01392 [Ganoderma sinense ZZ0214-1]|uniref:Uncharacterized protein n=1 Tax=Ganoderma sinense ZZ0214-1 TaxID=1077348 RepID=A0A2G8SVX4_9APHY|nr:hypothetical protein GSI_01392 [Ganoderma sinense ZZ0214-1]